MELIKIALITASIWLALRQLMIVNEKNEKLLKDNENGQS